VRLPVALGRREKEQKERNKGREGWGGGGLCSICTYNGHLYSICIY